MLASNLPPALGRPAAPAATPSLQTPSSCTPNGFTANIDGGAGGDAVAPDAVLLHPQWIHREHRGTAVVEIGIQQDGDVVVRVDVVAVGEGGAHRTAVPLERAGAGGDGVGRGPDQHLGRILGGTPLPPGGLPEPPGPGAAGPRPAAPPPRAP